MRFLFILFIIIQFFYGISGYALDRRYNLAQCRMDVWSVRDGLPSQPINQIIQTSDGFIWLATGSGLIRFDGQQFKTYNSRNTRGLKNDNIQTLFQDRDNRLWIGGSWLGFGVFRNGAYYGYGPNISSWSVVNTFTQTQDGSIWVGGHGTNSIFQIKNDQVISYPNFNDAITKLIDLSDHILVSQTNSGSLLIDKKSKISAVSYKSRLPVDAIQAAEKALDGSVWYGTRRNGLIHADKKNTIKIYKIKDGLSSNTVNCLLADREGRIWIGTNKGISVWNGHTFSTYGREHGLPYPDVYSLYEDREGNIWVGNGSQLCRFAVTKLQPYSFIIGPYSVNIVPYNSIADVTSFDSNQIDNYHQILCTTNAGLCSVDNDGYRWFNEPFNCDESIIAVGPDKLAWYICLDHVFTIPEYYLRFYERKDTNTIASNVAINQHLNSNIDNAKYCVNTKVNGKFNVCVAEKGKLTGFSDSHIWQLAPGKVIKTVNCSIGWVFNAAQDKELNFWVGSSDGLVYVSHNLKVIKIIPVLQHAHVLGIYIVNSHCIWMATDHGLQRYCDGVLTCYTTVDGLVSNEIFQIQIDSNNSIWLSDPCGISSIRLSDISNYDQKLLHKIPVTSYGSSDGIRGYATSFFSIKDSVGNLWFTGPLGLISVDPQHTPLNKYVPPVVVTEAKLDSTVLKPGIVNTVPAGSGALYLRFSALSYSASEKVRYRYRLYGIDNRWIETNNHEVNYKNLPYGEYVFKVIACNSDGVWNNNGVDIRFNIAPHPYQTLWFRILCSICLLAILWEIYVLRLRSINKRNIELEKIISERTALLKESNEQLQSVQTELVAQNEELLAISDELKSANEQLAALATTDGLTGIKNHRAFQEELVIQWQRHTRNYNPVSIILIDVDHFKLYNDKYGHPAGDKVLIKVAQTISHSIRETDFAARYGGEEFIVIAPDTGIDGSLQLAERIRLAIENEKWPNRFITVSIGVSTTAAAIDNASILVSEADNALYRSKSKGRNCVTHSNDNVTSSRHI